MQAERERVVELLASGPARLRALVAGLEGRLETRPGPDDWSAADVLGHVEAADAILAPRVMQILTRPGAPLPAFDERVWAQVAARSGLSLAQRLDLFAARRLALVGLVRTLSAEEWGLEGQHELGGPTSVGKILAHLADHEREHLDQLASL